MAEYRHNCAPSSRGCWNAGPRKVLSTITTGWSGCVAAACAARSISIMVMVGFAGVSMYTMQGLRASRMAFSSAAESPGGTGTPVTAERGQEAVDQAGGSAVERGGVDNGAIGPRVGEERRHDRGHPGVEHRGVGGAGLEGHNLVFQNLRVGMREPRVDQLRPLAILGLDLAGGDGERRARLPPGSQTRRSNCETLPVSPILPIRLGSKPRVRHRGPRPHIPWGFFCAMESLHL